MYFKSNSELQSDIDVKWVDNVSRLLASSSDSSDDDIKTKPTILNNGEENTFVQIECRPYDYSQWALITRSGIYDDH